MNIGRPFVWLLNFLRGTKELFLLFLIVLAAGGFVYFYLSPESENQPESSSISPSRVSNESQPEPSSGQIQSEVSNEKYRIGALDYVLETVSDAAGRQKGLSGRSHLPQRQGMLFVFQSSGDYSIWMKDMNFALDIIWLGSDWRVVGLAETVQPSSYPQSFYAETDSSYVIEINAGEVARAGLRIGDRIVSVN